MKVASYHTPDVHFRHGEASLHEYGQLQESHRQEVGPPDRGHRSQDFNREQILESIVHSRHAKELYQTRAFAGKFLWTHWANKVNRGMVLDLVGQWFIALNTLERKKRPCYP